MELKPHLTKKQRELYRAFVDPIIEEILFWGWGRWGKTRWVAEILNITCLQFPWISRLVGRREWDDLRKTSLNTILKVLHHHKLVKGVHYQINMQTKEVKYFNGSKIDFVPLRLEPSDPEFNRLGWYEETFAWVDEAQEVDRKAIDVIKSRLTEKIKEYDLVGKVIMTCNPDKWHLYSTFIKPRKEGTLQENRTFIQSLYSDNPHIDHEKYEASLADANIVTRKRILLGDWDYDDSPGRLFDFDKICDLATNPKVNGSKYISCDVARMWQDKAIIRVRNWLEEIDKVVYKISTTTQIQDKIRELCQRHVIPMSNVIVDEDGVGGWVVDSLRCKGFVNNSTAIDTRTPAQVSSGIPKPNFDNLKTQCYFELAKKVNSGEIRLTELSDDLKQELDNIVQINLDKDWPIRIIKKEDLKKKIGRSPDEADSLMMRMYFELRPKPMFTFASL